jgi:hypothetical protein
MCPFLSISIVETWTPMTVPFATDVELDPDIEAVPPPETGAILVSALTFTDDEVLVEEEESAWRTMRLVTMPIPMS